MSIQSEIDRIEQNVANTYSVLAEAGAPMPNSMDSDNLAGTAANIAAILYNKNQNLTEAQKTQARENINAASAETVDLITEEIDITPGTVTEVAVEIFNNPSYTWQEGIYINYTDGNAFSNNQYYGCEDYFEIPEGARFFAAYSNAVLQYPSTAFYTEAKTFISGEFPELSSTSEREEFNGLYGHFYNVPSNARYLRFSVNINFKEILSAYVISEKAVGGKVEIPNLVGYKSLIEGKSVVCFGDSLIGMYRDETSVTAKLADFTGATVYNVGFGGCRMSVHPTSGYAAFSMWALAEAINENNWTTQDAQASSGSSYFPEQLAKLKSIDFNKVDMVVIHYGTNDFSAGGNGVLIDNASDPDDYNTLCGALRYSIEKLLSKYPKLRIFISLPCFRYWESNGVKTYSDTYKNTNGNTLIEFVEALRSVAAEYNLPVIDSYYGLGVNKINATTYLQADGTHHTVAGRKLFGEYLGANLVSQQTTGKAGSAGIDTEAVNELIANAIGAAIGGAY